MTGRDRQPNVASGRIRPEDLKRFPRRRCRNCDKPYYLTRKHKKFCTTECKDEFHRHGSAFGPLKNHLTKLIRETGKEEAARQFEAYLSGADFRKHLSAAGFIHRSQILKPKFDETGAALRGAVTILGRLLKEHEERVLALEQWRATGHLVGLPEAWLGPPSEAELALRPELLPPGAVTLVHKHDDAAARQVDLTEETTAPCPDKPARRNRTKKK